MVNNAKLTIVAFILIICLVPFSSRGAAGAITEAHSVQCPGLA